MFTIVTCTYKRDPAPLARAITTWRNQTLSPRIVVVDANVDRALSNKIRKLCDGLIYIHAPSPIFNISRLFNIGIKRSAKTQYVLCTGAEIMFSLNYLEYLATIMRPDRHGVSTCGSLRPEVQVPDDPHSEWDRLIAGCDCTSYVQISPGTIFCAARDWWFRVRGYDERQHFAWADSEMIRRATLSGIRQTAVIWDKAQAIHQWHKRSKLVAALPGRWLDEIRRDETIIRNPRGWGEL